MGLADVGACHATKPYLGHIVRVKVLSWPQRALLGLEFSNAPHVWGLLEGRTY
jgi:hypothetical protein